MIRVFLFLSAIAAAFLPTAAMADETPERVQACADVEDDVRRLQCYDRSLSGDMAEAASQPDAVDVETQPAYPVLPVTEPLAPVAPPSEAPPTAEERFGLDVEAERDASEDEPDQIGARITAIDARRYGERIFTLDNGQVWAEKSANPRLRLQVGDEVTIRSGLFGSYKLFGSGNKSSSVDRVR